MRALFEKGIFGNMRSSEPFDFCAAMRRLCDDISGRVSEFQHIRMEQVAVSFAQARRRVSYGLQAKLTPMRFEQGSLYTMRHGRNWTVQRLYHDHREMLYILTFYLPRFQDHSFREKMITVFHELYHISATFDGDIRRMEGRYHAHSHSQKEYDLLMETFVDKYLAMKPDPNITGFLKKRFRALQKDFGAVVGLQIPIPKMIPVEDKRPAA